jgi:hypothetical protein
MTTWIIKKITMLILNMVLNLHLYVIPKNYKLIVQTIHLFMLSPWKDPKMICKAKNYLLFNFEVINPLHASKGVRANAIFGLWL